MSRVSELFIKLAQISSPSGKEQEIALFIKDYLKNLGYKVKQDTKGNLIVHTKSLKTKAPVLLFCAHMDTVTPAQDIKPIIKNSYICSSGNSILGADDKAGIAAILEMLQRIKKDKILFNQIKVIFTVEEEIDLLGAKALSKSAVQADYGFVLDADGEVGQVINQAPYLNSFLISIRGKAAHAGIAPEQGINAIKIAAQAISKLPDGRIDKQTTINIGKINGGAAQNIVAEEVKISAEIRSHQPEKLDKYSKLLKDTFTEICQKYHGKLKIESKRSFNGLNIAPTHPIIKLIEKSAKLNKLPFKVMSCGGGSDAQIINNLGVPTVVLSTGMEKIHSTAERIKIKNIERLADLLVTIVREANESR